MQFGWCAPVSEAPLLAALGFDFIELPLATMNLEDDTSFASAKSAVRGLPVPPLAFNVFMPRDMRVVGPEIDEIRVKAYLGRAAEVLEAAGAQIVVYGSGWSRNLPDGWPRDRQEAQFIQALDWSADALQGSGVTLVIEPLNPKELDIATSVDEGARFAAAVDRPEIRVLADFYHMDEEAEPFDTLVRNASWLAHIHLADTGRKNPGTGCYPYAEFFGRLKEAGYKGLLSAECSVDDPEANRRASLAFLRDAWGRA